MTNDVPTNRAKAEYHAGNLAKAWQLCEEALRADRRDAEARHLQALILQSRGQAAASIELFHQAIALAPQAVGYHNNLAIALQSLGRFFEAEAAYRKALDIKPEAQHVRANLDRMLQQASHASTLKIHPNTFSRPDEADAWNDRGIERHQSGDLEQSLDAFRQAVAMRPSLAPAWNNLGNVLRYSGQLDQAIAAYRRAISIQVDYPDAHQGLAMALLQSGDFANGWLEYEWRWKVSTARPRQFSQPRWCGENPAGKKIFVHEEQGYGDSIQFFRYAALLADRGAHVIVGCRQGLAKLLGEMPGIANVIVAGEMLPAFDLHCPVMSLPLLFETRLETVPSKVPYFNPAPDRIARWAKRVGHDNSLKVGLAWAGNPELGNDRIRSIPFHDIESLAGLANIAFHSLQITPIPAENQSRLNIRDHCSFLIDFAETAALIANLDLIIGVDTAVAHLAGAIGKPTWILLPSAPDWRWMIDRDDSPWYPTASLLRQRRQGEWADVIAQVRDKLVGVLSKPRTAPTPGS